MCSTLSKSTQPSAAKATDSPSCLDPPIIEIHSHQRMSLWYKASTQCTYGCGFIRHLISNIWQRLMVSQNMIRQHRTPSLIRLHATSPSCPASAISTAPSASPTPSDISRPEPSSRHPCSSHPREPSFHVRRIASGMPWVRRLLLHHRGLLYLSSR